MLILCKKLEEKKQNCEKNQYNKKWIYARRRRRMNNAI
jgi:hypothetical protein